MIKTSLKEVENYLIELGLKKNDKILIHADLRVFGRLEGNGNGFLELIKSLISNDGLMCTPSFTFSFPHDFDIKNSKSNIGAITNLFSEYKDVKRVPDGMTSYYMIGNNSSKIIDEWSNSSYGKNSIIDQLFEKNAKVLQLGTDILSPIHYLEEKVGVPYRTLKRFAGLIIDENISYHSHTNFYARNMDIKKLIPDPIRADFYGKLLNSIQINGRQLRLFELRKFIEFGLPRLEDNNLILIED